MSRKFDKVAVLLGGFSNEREISIRSGNAVVKGLREWGYEVTPVDVLNESFEVPDCVEAAFIALHGLFGEDGKIQAVLDKAGMPYTGSGAESSRIAFDKLETKLVFNKNGISTPKYEILSGPSATRTLPLPVVLKPLLQGSSMGVHRVFIDADWDTALADAVRYDGIAMAEECVVGRELTVGILGDTVLPVLEIRAPDGYYDYIAKYTKGVTEYLVPAPLDGETNRICEELTINSYRALGCRGFGRVDIMLDEEGNAFVLELNTIPGFTETSLLPKSAAAAGIAFPELCHRIMDMARCGG